MSYYAAGFQPREHERRRIRSSAQSHLKNTKIMQMDGMFQREKTVFNLERISYLKWNTAGGVMNVCSNSNNGQRWTLYLVKIASKFCVRSFQICSHSATDQSDPFFHLVFTGAWWQDWWQEVNLWPPASGVLVLMDTLKLKHGLCYAQYATRTEVQQQTTTCFQTGETICPNYTSRSNADAAHISVDIPQ